MVCRFNCVAEIHTAAGNQHFAVYGGRGVQRKDDTVVVVLVQVVHVKDVSQGHEQELSAGWHSHALTGQGEVLRDIGWKIPERGVACAARESGREVWRDRTQKAVDRASWRKSRIGA